MSRIHLFEFEDQSWFPGWLRNYVTDFLQFLSIKTSIFDPVVPVLKKGLDKTQHKTIIDLGSGAGGALLRLNKALRKDIPGLRIVLTDYYPNLPAFKRIRKDANNITFVKDPVDARKVDKSLKGLRTLFLAFHHFRHEDARKILQDAVDAGQPLAVFEGQERSFPSLLAMFFSPLTVLLITPFIRPFSFGRIIFTYLLPLVPLFVWWDGLVSSLRTYSVKEMEELVAKVKNQESYEWEIKKIKSGPGAVLYLLARPK